MKLGLLLVMMRMMMLMIESVAASARVSWLVRVRWLAGAAASLSSSVAYGNVLGLRSECGRSFEVGVRAARCPQAVDWTNCRLRCGAYLKRATPSRRRRDL